MRVLVVEDEPGAGKALSMLLADAGREVQGGIAVHLVEDAETALDVMRLLEFDLLLVDMRLPGMSGQDMIRTLRGAGQAVPAILMSGLIDDNDLASASGACSTRRLVGANAWLTKPLSRRTLLETIDEVMTRRSSLPPGSGIEE